jgi:hypothetical protein
VTCFTAAGLMAVANGFIAGVLGILYIGLMRFSNTLTEQGLFRIYKIFPWFNAIAGFLIFLSVAWPKFF